MPCSFQVLWEACLFFPTLAYLEDFSSELGCWNTMKICLGVLFLYLLSWTIWGSNNLEFFTNRKFSSIILYLIPPPPDPFSPLCGTPVSYLWDIVCLFALIHEIFFLPFNLSIALKICIHILIWKNTFLLFSFLVFYISCLMNSIYFIIALGII